MRPFAIIIFFLTFLSAIGQGFRTRHFVPGALNNSSKAIFETSYGNYIAGGIIVDQTTGSNRLCVMGLDSLGKIIWTKKYGNLQFEYLDNTFISRSYVKQGNAIYYTGCVRDSNNKYIGVLIKFNLNGDTVWQKIFRDIDPLEDVIPQMLTGSVDGGMLITGFFQNNGVSPYSQCMLIKTNANGIELWRKKISKVIPNVQDGKAIIQDSATKKIVMVGYQYIGNANSPSMVDNVVILDSLGNQPTRFRYINGAGGLLLDMIQTRDNKIVAVGYRYGGQTVSSRLLMAGFAVKFDLNSPAVALWKMTLGLETLGNGFTCLTELKNGDIMVGGWYDTLQHTNQFRNDLIRLAKLKPNGQVSWKKYYDYKTNGTNKDNAMAPRAISLNSDGSLVGAIECFNFPAPNHFFFVKWDSTGCDSSLAYCQMLNSVDVKKNKLYDQAQIAVFPNPVGGLLHISVNGSLSDEELTLSIADVSGRIVKRLTLKSSDDHFKADINDLNNGVYMISLERKEELIYKGRLVKE
jgi:hypothetical protein